MIAHWYVSESFCDEYLGGTPQRLILHWIWSRFGRLFDTFFLSFLISGCECFFLVDITMVLSL